jgi:hypothetical protein
MLTQRGNCDFFQSEELIMVMRATRALIGRGYLLLVMNDKPQET